MTNRPTDHDLLIKLNTQFEVFSLQYKQDMLGLKDGYAKTMADHEFRINTLEKIIDEVNLLQTVKDFKTLQQQVRDFMVSANAFRIIGGLMGGVTFFILVQLPGILKTLGIIK